MSNVSIISIDVEDWFHILDSPCTPLIDQWKMLESRFHDNVELLLDLLHKHSVRATMFWLGWAAEKRPELVRRCCEAGHEIACHGYGHVLAYKVGRAAFGEDVRKGKQVIEAIISQPVKGFRAAGFSTTDDTTWVFDEIRAAGYTYDSSVFPSSRGHGGMTSSRLEPHTINTESGILVEIPQSMIEVLGKRISVFGGGYLRLSPMWLIEYGIRQLDLAGRPLIIYIHPREIDPVHPRLPLSRIRSFKSYFNLKSTMPKLEGLLGTRTFILMDELASMVEGISR